MKKNIQNFNFSKVFVKKKTPQADFFIHPVPTALHNASKVVKNGFTINHAIRSLIYYYSQTTDTGRLNLQLFAAQSQILIPNKYLECGYKGLVFCRNNG